MGVIAANSFGPLLRFALGAGYCSRHLANHLSRARADGSLAELPVSPQRSAD
jgi:hypothetical protein